MKQFHPVIASVLRLINLLKNLCQTDGVVSNKFWPLVFSNSHPLIIAFARATG